MTPNGFQTKPATGDEAAMPLEAACLMNHMSNV